MAKLETKEELEALHTGNVGESLYLEYKASDAIDKNSDAKKIEMARDVSAFANADGGQIVYGMTEKDHKPAGLDQGIDPKAYPEIWFDQVLQQHITPNLTGHRIRHVPLHDGAVAIVIDIAATKGDPHQTSDGKYYRRHNFNRLQMEHYEIRDMIRRAVDPALEIEFESPQTLEFDRHSTMSKPVPITTIVRNKSNQPSMYTLISVFIDRRVELGTTDGYERDAEIAGLAAHHLRQRIGVPSSYPIFREQPLILGPVYFSINERLIAYPLKLTLGYQIRAPGCFKENHGTIDIDQSGRMSIRMPPN
jgi:schlafen family protein